MTTDGTRAKALANDLLVYAKEVEEATSARELEMMEYGIIPGRIAALEDEWDTAQAQLASMLRDLGRWIQHNVSEEGTLSVLGL